jgi:hypothetical protein
VNVRGADCLKAQGDSADLCFVQPDWTLRLLAGKQWRSPATALICGDDDSAGLRRSCARNGHGAPAFCHNGRNATPLHGRNWIFPDAPNRNAEFRKRRFGAC